MTETLSALLTSLAAAIGAALLPDHGAAALVAAGVTAVVVGIAVLAVARLVLGAARGTGAAPSALEQRLELPLVLPQSDPDAPGRARPRAPGMAAPAA